MAKPVSPGVTLYSVIPVSKNNKFKFTNHKFIKPTQSFGLTNKENFRRQVSYRQPTRFYSTVTTREEVAVIKQSIKDHVKFIKDNDLEYLTEENKQFPHLHRCIEMLELYPLLINYLRDYLSSNKGVINCRCVQGNTALHLARKNISDPIYLDAVYLLWRFDIDTEAVNNSGERALNPDPAFKSIERYFAFYETAFKKK
jgi:hypothetical protein